MGGLFGGGQQGDNGAAERIAEANRQAERERAAAQAAADEKQRKEIAEQKAAAEKASQDLAAKNDAAIKQSEKDAAQQAAARANTGSGQSFDNTRSDTAKALAISQQNKGGGLPGFNSMLPTAPQGGFAGQSNSLTSQPLAGKQQAPLPGGRRYV